MQSEQPTPPLPPAHPLSQPQAPILEQCQNCHILLPQQKMGTHYSYCRRNIRKCQQCPHYYDRNYVEEHQMEFHASVRCERCQGMFRVGEMQGHRRGCGPKMVLCQYCENVMPELVYEGHVDACGARTVICDICNKPVPGKELKRHEQSCLTNLCANQQKLRDQEDGQRGNKRTKRSQSNPRSVAVDIFNSRPSRPGQRVDAEKKEEMRQRLEERDRQAQIQKERFQRKRLREREREERDGVRGREKERSARPQVNQINVESENSQEKPQPKPQNRPKEIDIISLDQDAEPVPQRPHPSQRRQEEEKKQMDGKSKPK